jgi:hypothetical protein
VYEIPGCVEATETRRSVIIVSFVLSSKGTECSNKVEIQGYLIMTKLPAEAPGVFFFRLKSAS